MSSWQSDFIHANGIRIHYTRTGGAKPPLVLAHGVSDDGLCWTSVAQDLAADFDVIMVDARGHGLPDAPEQGYSPLEQSDDLAGVITGLKLSRPIVLGHSMGAMCTLTLAGRYPDLPAAIVLEDPPPWWTPDFDPPFTRRVAGAGPSWISALQSQSREDLIAAQRAESPDWPEVDRGSVGRVETALQSQVLQPSRPRRHRLVRARGRHSLPVSVDHRRSRTRRASYPRTCPCTSRVAAAV